MNAPRVVVAVLGSVVLVAAAAVTIGRSSDTPTRPEPSSAVEAYGRLPLTFEENRGQSDPQVRYLARTGAGTVFLTETGAVLAGREGSLALRLEGARSGSVIEGVERQAGATNYVRSADPAQWQVGVPSYAQVRYRDAYPGVDLMWHGGRGALEYDFLVSPGADPSSIALVAEGAGATRLEPNGDLVLSVGDEEVRHRRPEVYQDIGGTRRPVQGAFVLADSGRIGFEVGSYDRSHTLVIDPLVYSTYLGGNRMDITHDVAVDGSGNAYVLGDAQSSDFPTTPGAFQTTHTPNNYPDVFVTKFNSSGSALVYSTFLGQGNPSALALDSSGNVFVGGTTGTPTIPVTAGSFRTAIVGRNDGFVIKLNAAGNAVEYGTYLGGNIEALAIDSAGSAYVAGLTIDNTAPGDFSSTPGAFQPSPGGSLYYDAFVAKLNPSGSALSYATYLGGSIPDTLDGIAVDGAGSAYVTGNTVSLNFPTTPGAFQVTKPSAEWQQSAVVVKLNPTGSALDYATFLAGSHSTTGRAVELDPSGNAYVAGVTHGPSDFPTTANAFQPTKPNLPAGTSTGFLTKLNPAGSGLVYSTYFGGTSGSTVPIDVALDGSGNAYLAGSVQSQTLPLQDPVQNQHMGGYYDAFVSKLGPSGSTLLFSTYLGGAVEDPATGVTVDGAGGIYVVGNSQSLNFPVANAFQPQRSPAAEPGLENDAFLTKISVDQSEPGPPPPADFDGDGDTDVAVFRPSSGTWFVQGGTTAAWGASGDIPVPGDYDGDGDTDVAVFRPSSGTWFVQGGTTAAWGASGDIPVPGDYDGDGDTDVAVFRPSSGTWFVQGGTTAAWGASGDIPVPGDYDGDGDTDIAVIRNGIWFVRNGTTTAFGTSGDIPVPGDYDGNGTTDIAVFRPSNGLWFVQGGITVAWGASGDIPVPGDYDGNGTTDVAVLRPSSGVWFVRNGITTPWGTSGDYPLPLPPSIGQTFFP